jgi:hypothetical protein
MALWIYILKKYIEMTPEERAAYRKKLMAEHNIGWTDEALDKDLSRHSNYENIFVKIELND